MSWMGFLFDAARHPEDTAYAVLLSSEDPRRDVRTWRPRRVRAAVADGVSGYYRARVGRSIANPASFVDDGRGS